MWHSVTLNRFTIASSQPKLCGFKDSRPVYWPLRFQCICFFINLRVKGLNEIFLMLVCLQLGLYEQDIAYRFQVSQAPSGLQTFQHHLGLHLGNFAHQRKIQLFRLLLVWFTRCITFMHSTPLNARYSTRNA